MKRTSGLALTAFVLIVFLVSNAQAADLDSRVRTVGDARLETQNDSLDVLAQANASTGAHVKAQADTQTVGIDTRPQSSDTSMPAQAPAAGPVMAAAGTLLGLGLLVFVLTKLGLLGSFGLFSRIDSERILENSVRGRIHQAISENPGITIKEITEVCGIGWGTAIYHLKRLEDERLIVSERHRQYRRFFRNGGGIVNEAKGAYSELKNPTTQRLAVELISNPGAAQKDLCEAVGISAPLAHKYLSRMEAAQLLTKQREWKLVKYFPTSRLTELLPTQEPLLVAA